LRDLFEGLAELWAACVEDPSVGDLSLDRLGEQLKVIAAVFATVVLDVGIQVVL
jgi:hypothetical protein